MSEQLQLSTPMKDIICLQSDFLCSKPTDVRKTLGQYFTGWIASEYMASLISKPKSKTVRILDAGAGTGILTASTALRCLDIGCKTVHAVLFELDNEAIPNLEQTLKIVQDSFKMRHGSFSFEIRCEDFITARPDKDKGLQGFDVAAINPPYFKYSLNQSTYAKVVADLYHGDPNIYASFMAVVLACIKVGGQMVTITPRSFTNGLYFKGFREYLLSHSALDLIHIFKHRDKVFNNSDSAVLQENITVCSSDCDGSINHAEQKQYPYTLIIDLTNDQRMIRIPESADDASILRQAENLPTTFESAGYYIATGRVVEHRALQYITKETWTSNSIPLYRSHNVTPLTTTWTGAHKKDVSFFALSRT